MANLVGSYGSETPKKGALRSVYDAAATTQAEDYDKIMSGYTNVIDANSQDNSSRLPTAFNPISANAANYIKGTPYQRTGDLDQSLTRFRDFSQTGGYSEND